MLAVVKTPHIRGTLRGEFSEDMIAKLQTVFGEHFSIEEDTYLTAKEYYGCEVDDKVGVTVKLHRENKGYTQEKLGELIGGKSAQFISDLENGQRNISKKVAIALGDVLGHPYQRYL